MSGLSALTLAGHGTAAMQQPLQPLAAAPSLDSASTTPSPPSRAGAMSVSNMLCMTTRVGLSARSRSSSPSRAVNAGSMHSHPPPSSAPLTASTSASSGALGSPRRSPRTGLAQRSPRGMPPAHASSAPASAASSLLHSPASSVSTLASPSAASAAGSVARRSSPSVPPAPPPGYSYSSKTRSPRVPHYPPASNNSGGSGNGGGNSTRAASVPITRFNFHATGMWERAAAESLAGGNGGSAPSSGSHGSETSSLPLAAVAAFHTASLPSHSSATRAHYAAHPVTIGSVAAGGSSAATAAERAASAGAGERVLALMAPPPSIMQQMSMSSTGGGAINSAAALIYQYPHQRRPSFGNGNSLGDSHRAPAFDVATGAQLPPLSAYSRSASKDPPSLSVTIPPILPPAPAKHDRAVQTSPRASPAMSPTAAASAAAVVASSHSTRLPPFAFAPPPGSASAAAMAQHLLDAPIPPAAPPSLSSSDAPSHRNGYDWIHRRLLHLWSSDALKNPGGEEVLRLDEEPSGSEEEERKEPSVVPSTLSAFDARLATFYNQLCSWDEFDVFALYDATSGWPLSFLFLMIERKHCFLLANGIDPATAFHFIQEVEQHYLPTNPYHTATHAADVLHAAFHLVEHNAQLKEELSALDCLVLYISCAVHDICHPSVNNAYLCNARTPLALRYNDRSVLESFHISSAFRLMQAYPHCNLLAGFPFATYSKIRKTAVDLVLATDLAVHFELMSVFKRRLPTLNLRNSEEDRLMMMQILLKCGDLSHPARSRALHLKWSELVSLEFFQQGDREKLLGMPPSMFMDRESTNLAQSQIGFIRFLVLPMFAVYSHFDYWCRKVQENLDWWNEVAFVEAEEKKAEAERAPIVEEGSVSEPNSSTTSSHVTSRRASLEAANGEAKRASRRGSQSAGPTRSPMLASTPAPAASPSRSPATTRPIPPSLTLTLPLDNEEAKDAPMSDSTASASAANAAASSPTAHKSVSFQMPDSKPAHAQRGSKEMLESASAVDGSSAIGASPSVISSPPRTMRRTGDLLSTRRSRSKRHSSMNVDLALLSETAQIAALSAAGASAIEAKEHHEEEQAAAAAAASEAEGGTSGAGGGGVSTPRNSPGAQLLAAPSSKRKSVMTGVAPPASPLVLSRGVSDKLASASDGSSGSTASPGPLQLGARSLSLVLNERRALSLSGGAGSGGSSNVAPGSNTPSPLQGSFRSSSLTHTQTSSVSRGSGSYLGNSPMTDASSSSRSSLASPLVPADGGSGVGTENASAASGHDDINDPNTPAPALEQHMAELEASHGWLYNQVRELASLTAPVLQAAGLTAPVPTLAPSHAGPRIIPSFSAKAHQLLHIVPRPREATPQGTPGGTKN